jgi:hypothetical protein
MAIRNCNTCKHKELKDFEEPCQSCGLYSNYQEFEQFGSEWESEMLKLKKIDVIQLYKDSCIKLIEIKNKITSIIKKED